MGRFLREARRRRGHTQADVAAAIGRHPQYVSEVERGARGARMSPLVAVTWAHYLSLDPTAIFQYLGLDDDSGRGAQARQYLETVMWADKVLRAQRGTRKALDKVQGALSIGSDLRVRDELQDARIALQDVLAALSAPQTGRGQRNGSAE